MKGKKLSCQERTEKLERDASYRKQIFKDLLVHISKGFSLDCFSALSENTIRTYIKQYPTEFVQEELEQAMRDGKESWEQIGYRQSNGSCLGNSRSWFYNMAHRYKWSDRVQVEAEHKGQVAVNVVSYASTKAPSDTVEA